MHLGGGSHSRNYFRKPERTIMWDSDRTMVGARVREFVNLIDQFPDLIRHLAENVAPPPRYLLGDGSPIV